MCVVIAGVLLPLSLCQSVFQMRVLLATTDNVSQLEQQREEEEQRAKQQAEERGNITMGGLAGHGDFFLMGVYELMDVKEKWVNRRAVYKKAGSECYLYFTKNGRWVIGSKASVDKGNGGMMRTPDSGAFTPGDVPADRVWKASNGNTWVELPQVHARHN